MANDPTAIKTITNKFDKACRNCGSNVPAGTGHAHLVPAQPKPKWVTEHLACPAEGPAVPAERVVAFAPTAEQADCVAKFMSHRDLVIQAGAGAGKTSTLMLMAQAAQNEGRRGVVTAFNKAIVKDIAAKATPNLTCMTMHALAHAAVGVNFKHRLNSSARQAAHEQASILGITALDIPFGDGVKTLHREWLVSKAMKAVRSFMSSADHEPGRRHFAYIDGVDMPTENGDRTYDNNDAIAAHLLPAVRKAWADLSDPNGSLRYSHDSYLKLWQLSEPRIQADFIMLDEAQDADPVQVAIIEAQRQYGTQIVVVGDEQQVIYEWRGAVDALARFEAMGAQVAVLSQSFRFGDAVAAVANGLLARNDARLRLTGFSAVASVVGPVAEPDAILTRSNAGAVRQALSQIAAGRKPHIVGGGAEVIDFCKAALDLQAGRSTRHPELSIFADWAAVQNYALNDEQGEDLRLMVKLIDEFGAKVIIDALSACAAERDADVVISTAHKSKGREWDSVALGTDFMPPMNGAKELSPAELRLAYVAVTRAKRLLDIENTPHLAVGWKPEAA